MKNLSYEDYNSLAFDKPLTYKNIKLYPILMSDYLIFKSFSSCLTVEPSMDKDMKYIRLSYLDYIYMTTERSKEEKIRWEGFKIILGLIFQEQKCEIILSNSHILLKVYQSPEVRKLDNDNITDEDRALIEDLLNSNKEEKFTIIDSKDFDEIRQLVCKQNDIKIENWSPKAIQSLEETLKKMKESNVSDDDLEYEDMIDGVAFHMKKTPLEIENWTLRRFNRYFEMLINKDKWNAYAVAQASGMVSFEGKIEHWIKHYEPKGKYDSLLLKSSSLSTMMDSKI